MLKDLLSFLGLMFAKHPVTSISTDHFLPAAGLPRLTHCLETLNGVTNGWVPASAWAAREVRILSKANEEGPGYSKRRGTGERGSHSEFRRF